MNHIRAPRRPRAAVLLALVAALAACESQTLAVPEADEARDYYSYQGSLKAEVSGNVATVTVTQDADQLRRGGELWAKVGPYVVLFSKATDRLFQDYDGLAAVRVVTELRDGTEIARAILDRSTLSDVQWRRALNIAGRARRDGTEKLGLLSDLVRWGEEHTEYEYNPRYVR